MAGTADRRSGDVPSAGLRGFQLPYRGSAQTKEQYAKVVHIRWRPEFEKYGDFGGHTDALKAPFVQHYMAPLIMAGMAREAPVASAAGKVRNPDYGRGLSATLWQNESLPGGMARVWLKSNMGGRPFEFRGDVVGYRVR